MFYRQKNFVCDRRPVFECRQNAVVWRRRRWRVGSRLPRSLGRGRTNIDEHRDHVIVLGGDICSKFLDFARQQINNERSNHYRSHEVMEDQVPVQYRRNTSPSLWHTERQTDWRTEILYTYRFVIQTNECGRATKVDIITIAFIMWKCELIPLCEHFNSTWFRKWMARPGQTRRQTCTYVAHSTENIIITVALTYAL